MGGGKRDAAKLGELEGAIRAKKQARIELQAATRRADELLGELSAAGVPSTTIAIHVARAEGQTASVTDRRRLRT